MVLTPAVWGEEEEEEEEEGEEVEKKKERVENKSRRGNGKQKWGVTERDGGGQRGREKKMRPTIPREK